MQITALLSWYDENPDWLRTTIHSLTKIPVNRLIALDGAYSLYPNGQHRSSHAEYKAIIHSCHHHGIDLTLHTPATTWHGNEIEKRNRLFELAEQTTQPGDWLMVIDADEHVTQAPDDIPDQLAHTPLDVASVHLHEPGHPNGPIVYDTFPMFFRAIPGLRCHTNHFTYRTPDGRNLWGDAKRNRLEPRHPTNTIVEHRTQLRHPDRRTAALSYYRNRDHAGIEELPPDRTLLKDAA